MDRPLHDRLAPTELPDVGRTRIYDDPAEIGRPRDPRVEGACFTSRAATWQ